MHAKRQALRRYWAAWRLERWGHVRRHQRVSRCREPPPDTGDRIHHLSLGHGHVRPPWQIEESLNMQRATEVAPLTASCTAGRTSGNVDYGQDWKILNFFNIFSVAQNFEKFSQNLAEKSANIFYFSFSGICREIPIYFFMLNFVKIPRNFAQPKKYWNFFNICQSCP